MMYKTELIWAVAEKTDFPKDVSARAVGALLDAISEAVSQGEDVVLPGFGTFTCSTRKARKGRNPKTGEAIEIPAYTIPVFRPSKKLKASVNAK